MDKIENSEFRIVELSNEEYFKLWDLWGPQIFLSNSTRMDIQKVLSEEERARVRELHKNLSGALRINLGVFRGEEFCGWFSGDQYNAETFYMRNSAIIPKYRLQGLYTMLMNDAIKRIKDLGFQIILSRHSTVNNSIIIPKLNAGFIITALEVSDRFGTLVHLSYYFNEDRRRVMEFRAGELSPDAKLKDQLGIK